MLLLCKFYTLGYFKNHVTKFRLACIGFDAFLNTNGDLVILVEFYIKIFWIQIMLGPYLQEESCQVK